MNQGRNQSRGQFAELLRMDGGELSECAIAFRCQLEHHTSPVLGIVGPANQPSQLAALAQFHSGMVPQTQRFRYIADRHQHGIRRTRDLQQKLMLLRFKSGRNGGTFAELKKTPHLPPELRKDLDFLTLIDTFRTHIAIIS